LTSQIYVSYLIISYKQEMHVKIYKQFMYYFVKKLTLYFVLYITYFIIF